MPQFLVEQLANGVQFGLMLFLIAAGLTVVFGIMNTVNLAHGSLYMAGAYLGAFGAQASGSFLVGLGAALSGVACLAALLETMIFRRLYARDPLTQVLATFALILIANDGMRWLFGPLPLRFDPPPALAGPIELWGIAYPAYRLAVIVAGLTVALSLHLFLKYTRLGLWVRASAANREMAAAMGIDVRRLFLFLFVLGAVLAAFAGAMLAPLTAVQIGMGENALILAFVVIVIGGIGSMRGALIASLLVGILDTLGRAFLPSLLREMTTPALASHLGPTLASLTIYLVMAIVLYFRPAGLLPNRL